MRNGLYCGGPGCSVTRFALGVIQGGQHIPEWLRYPGWQTVLAHRARVAEVLAWKVWGLAPGDEVLAPAYNCGAELDPLMWCGARIIMYRIDTQARADIADIRRRCTPRTRMLYVIHYFGWEQDLRELLAFCRERDIRLLEDCALALFSRGTQGTLGTLADGSVFSLSKSLAVPDGGALVLREPQMAPPPPPASPACRPVAVKALPLFKSHFMRRCERYGVYPLAQRLIGRSLLTSGETVQTTPLPDIPEHYYFRPQIAECGPSRATCGLLRHVDAAEVARRRRANYRCLLDGLQGLRGVQVLYPDLPEGVCPLAFPMIVPERERWVSDLLARGIAAITWWDGYHQRVNWNGYAEARWLKENLMVLPVHQDLDLEHMQYIVDQVRQVGAEWSGRSRVGRSVPSSPLGASPLVDAGGG